MSAASTVRFTAQEQLEKRMAEAIAKVVAKAPPLKPAQRDRLAAILQSPKAAAA